MCGGGELVSSGTSHRSSLSFGGQVLGLTRQRPVVEDDGCETRLHRIGEGTSDAVEGEPRDHISQ